MIIIQETIIEEDVLDSYFACELNACKGACCWEGDYGAPLDEDELEILDEIQTKVLPYLSEESQEYLDNKKGYTYFKGMKSMGTSLHPDGSCVYLTTDKNGIALCGIETSWRNGDIAFQKPISCHLYPIRVENEEQMIFPVLKYDRWDICNPACNNGAANKIKLIEFAKTPIVRKYGESFYNMLLQYAKRYE